MRFYQKKLFSVLLAIVGASLSAEESGEQRDKVYAKVRAHLMLEFTAIDDTERSSAAWIKQNLGASDEQIRKAMMDIHREAVLTHSNAPEQDSRSLSRMRLEGAIRELWGVRRLSNKGFSAGLCRFKGKRRANQELGCFLLPPCRRCGRGEGHPLAISCRRKPDGFRWQVFHLPSRTNRIHGC